MVSRLVLSLCITALVMVPPSSGMCNEVKEQTLSLAKCIEIALNNATSAKKAKYNLKLQGADVLKNLLRKLHLAQNYLEN